MHLIDTHCHLFMDPLCRDVEGVLIRCRRVGVEYLVVPAVEVRSWDRIVELSSRPGIFAALGLHPWNADERFDLELLERSLLSSGAVAIGEIGLDFKIDEPGRASQLIIFRQQLDLALKLDLPVILHCRGAFEEMLSILEERTYNGKVRGVVHAFSRGIQLAQRFLDLGFHLSFGGVLTRSRAKKARRSAELVPLSRILLETDSPSIGMEGIPPGEVEPVHVLRVAESLSELRKIPLEDITRITLANADTLFGLGTDA